MKFLTADEILALDDLGHEVVEVPEWGTHVRIATMSGSDRDAWEASLSVDGQINMRNIRARLVARCARNEDGTRLFSDEQADALGNKNGNVLERLAAAARKLNKLDEADLKELEKN